MRRSLSLAVAIAITATACGGSSGSSALESAIKAETGQDVDVQQNGDGFTVETDDGSITFGADGDSTDITTTDADGNEFSLNSGTDVPTDFPLPVPDNVDISSATTFEMPEGTSYGLIFDFDPSRVDEISNLYRDALESQGLNVEGSGSGTDGEVIVADSDSVAVIVLIDNYGEYWEASISWTPM